MNIPENTNIAAWSHVNRQINTDTNILGQAYRYDALNRLTRAQTYTGGGATAFLSKYRYDQGGNILSLKRHDASGTIIDSMAYLYTRNADGELVHNRLNSVNDLGTSAGMPTGTSAYTYDRDGMCGLPYSFPFTLPMFQPFPMLLDRRNSHFPKKYGVPTAR